MIPGVNPWLLLGALSVILVSFTGGVSVGKDLERAEWLERDNQLQQEVKAETERGNKIALIYGTSLSTSQDTAFQLRRKLNEQRDNLAACLPDGGVRFTSAFVRLHDSALQTNAGNSVTPAGEADGAGVTAERVADVGIENGQRWKACRLQLNALIDILEPVK